MTDTHLALVLGTRPEIIKFSPILRECERRGISFTLIHTGQHYSEDLNTVFFDQLDLPTPEHNLGIGSGTHGRQTGEMLIEIEEVILEESPSVVLVQGDTNSTLAGALATSKLDSELGHVEAGLRSFDDRMPEETNRVLTDHSADYLFAPTETAVDFLREEGIDESKIFQTGNTIVDAVEQNAELAAERSDALADLGIDAGEYVLLTAHRAENVDERGPFTGILEGTARIGERLGVPVVYPIHPRACERTEELDIEIPPGIDLVEPLDFLDFLHLEANARVAVTDSGGVQEETCVLGTPCVTVRESTERPETVDVGANEVVGTNPDRIAEAGTRIKGQNRDWENPFGDGCAAVRILDALTT